MLSVLANCCPLSRAVPSIRFEPPSAALRQCPFRLSRPVEVGQAVAHRLRQAGFKLRNPDPGPAQFQTRVVLRVFASLCRVIPERQGLWDTHPLLTSSRIDQDGRLDIFITNFSHDWNNLYIAKQVGSGEGPIYFKDRGLQTMGQQVYYDLSWGCGWYDFDNDAARLLD